MLTCKNPQHRGVCISSACTQGRYGPEVMRRDAVSTFAVPSLANTTLSSFIITDLIWLWKKSGTPSFVICMNKRGKVSNRLEIRDLFIVKDHFFVSTAKQASSSAAKGNGNIWRAGTQPHGICLKKTNKRQSLNQCRRTRLAASNKTLESC